MNELGISTEGIQDIYENEFNHMFFSFAEELRFRSDEIKAGPEYNIRTNLGEALAINSLYLNGGGSQPYSSFPCFRIFFLYAYNKLNELIAQRISMLFRQQDRLVGQGRIDVLKRGTGIALPLELVHIDILQRQSDITTLPLIYQIQNTNVEELENTRILFKGRADGQAIINQKEMENRRWARLYGAAGLLGFDERLCRTFYPDFNNNDPFPIPASLFLRREDASDSKPAKGVVDSVKWHSVEEWENYERFAINRAFEEINRLSEGVGKYYK